MLCTVGTSARVYVAVFKIRKDKGTSATVVTAGLHDICKMHSSFASKMAILYPGKI